MLAYRFRPNPLVSTRVYEWVSMSIEFVETRDGPIPFKCVFSAKFGDWFLVVPVDSHLFSLTSFPFFCRITQGGLTTKTEDPLKKTLVAYCTYTWHYLCTARIMYLNTLHRSHWGLFSFELRRFMTYWHNYGKTNLFYGQLLCSSWPTKGADVAL